MDVPVNLKNRLNAFRTKISTLKNDCQNLLSKYDSIRETIEGNALEEAALDLTTAFTINSLFWLYLICKGLDPKNHDLRLEINRIKQANLRLKKLQEACKAPKINIPAAKRFIRSALWDPDNETPEKKAKTDDIDQNDNDDQQRKKRLLNEEPKEDIEMKSEIAENQEDESEESKDDEDDEEESEMVGEHAKEIKAEINPNNQDNSERSRVRGSRKRPNEKSNKGSMKRMFKKQMKKKPQRRSNRN